MKIVPSKHTHMSLPVEVRFTAIPTTWTPGENSDGERVLFPAVSQHEKRRLAPVQDPEEIRKSFFKTDDDEASTLEFLNTVGVWFAVGDMHGKQESPQDPRIRAMRFQGTFGCRYFNGRAMVLTPDYLAGERNYWRELLLDPTRLKLRAAFAPEAQDGHGMFKMMCNTLQVHMEWVDNHPLAVIQPITGTELLTALAWIDLLSGRTGKTCQKCGVPYTGGGSRFCDALCERASTKQAYRNRVRRAEALIRANVELPIPSLVKMLVDMGIPRKRAWVRGFREAETASRRNV